MDKFPQVRDWMTPNPITVTKDTTLLDAHKTMKEANIRRLPVLDGSKLVGIVTLGDLRGAQPSEATSLSVWEINYLVTKLTVKGIMSEDVVSATPEMPIRDAAALMLEKKISSLPVLEGGKLVGIITESDIFRMVVAEWEAEPVPA